MGSGAEHDDDHVEDSGEPFDAAKDGDDPEADELLLLAEHVIGEGGDHGGAEAGGSSTVEGEPTGDCSSDWEFRCL